MISERRETSFIFIFIVIFALYPVVLIGAEGNEITFIGGAGTSTDPYVIGNISDLQAVSNDLTAHYILKNDINATGTKMWNDNEGFVPIGTETSQFTGFFDGNNHTIFGLYINRLADNVGLFGYIGSGASVKNVHLRDIHIQGRHKVVGGLAGWNDRGMISGCSVTGQIKGGQHAGGLIGRNKGDVSNCFFKGNISKAGGFLASLFGGLIGINSGTVSKCFATINVSGNQYVSGFIADNSGNVYSCRADGNVNGTHPVGGLIADNSGVVSNCYFTGKVLGISQVGGLVGSNSGQIFSCNTSITANVRDWYVGGLVGTNYGKLSDCFATGDTAGGEGIAGLVGLNGGSISNCHASGNATGFGNFVGGLVGYNEGTISRCYSTGNTAGGEGIAGLVGRNEGSISNCHASGNATGSGDFVGGLVGYNEGTISRCYSTGNVTGNRSLGGLIGWNIGYVSNSHYNVEEVRINGRNLLTVGGIYKEQYQDWLSNDLILDVSDYRSTLVPSHGYFHIANDQGIKDMLGFTDVEGYRFRLVSDIDLIEDPGLHIPYIGSVEFDGNNHTISNVDLTDHHFNSNIGLIGCNQGGSIRNIHVDGNIAGEENIGGLVGYNRGMVSNCFSEMNVSGYSSVGGLLGYDNYATISHCGSSGNVEGYEYVGGLVGENHCKLYDCHTTVSVNGSIFVGGLAGFNDGPVSNCYTNGSVNGSELVGGLMGSNNDLVSGCHTEGSVNGVRYVGGLIGDNSGSLSNCHATGSVKGRNSAGGLSGYNGGTVSGCFSTGSVSSSSSSGGFTGTNNGIISGCYATGNVIRIMGSNIVLGGFVGYNSGKIIHCYSTGMVTYENATDPMDKGFAGNISAGSNFEMKGNFWDIQTSKQIATSGNAKGMNTSFMKTRTTFTMAGWDFRNEWCMIEKETYPLLRWQDTGPPTAIAGLNTTIEEGTIFEFNGSSSTDDIGIANYTWTFTDRKTVTLYGVRPTYRFDHPGSFEIVLHVFDAVGLRGADTMNVTVLDITPPEADAGLDQTIDEGTLITFNGSNSTDNVNIINYTWTFVDGNPIVLYGSQADYRFSDPGEYVVTLTIWDGSGNMDTDTITVIVKDITPPDADAGPDQTINEGTMITFNGSNSTDNVNIINYTWTFEYVDQDIVLFGISPSFVFNMPGIYSVILRVTDASGKWGEDSMTVYVQDITPPVANAGRDLIVPVETDVQLNGSLSSDNVAIIDYIWTFYYNGELQILEGEKASFTFDLGGSYEIVLTVMDDFSNTDEDSMTLKVIDTGEVRGIVNDENGQPVISAYIEITTSDGQLHTTETGANGSFFISIPHGYFKWVISKEGYKTISGNSSVKAMNETHMDFILESIPKETSERFFNHIYVSMIISIIVILGIVLIFIMKNRKNRDKSLNEDGPSLPEEDISSELYFSK